MYFFIINLLFDVEARESGYIPGLYLGDNSNFKIGRKLLHSSSLYSSLPFILLYIHFLFHLFFCFIHFPFIYLYFLILLPSSLSFFLSLYFRTFNNLPVKLILFRFIISPYVFHSIILSKC